MPTDKTCSRCEHPLVEHRNRSCRHLRMWVPNGQGSPHSLCGCNAPGPDSREAAAMWNAYMGRGATDAD